MAISNGNDDGIGDGCSTENSSKGKGKGKGKGKANAAAAAAAATSGAGSAAGAAAGSAGSFPQGVGEEEGGGEAGAPTGHAMLKSRLTSVSLRGLSQVDDKAVMVRTCLPPGSWFGVQPAWFFRQAFTADVLFCVRPFPTHLRL